MNDKTLNNKIRELESQGYVFEICYNTGKHLLQNALVKRWVDDEHGSYKTLIKYVENGKIKNYAK